MAQQRRLSCLRTGQLKQARSEFLFDWQIHCYAVD
jgi:hypothetical protein